MTMTVMLSAEASAELTSNASAGLLDTSPTTTRHAATYVSYV